MSDKIFTPVNPNAQACVKNVMKYLSDITYNQIITGQHKTVADIALECGFRNLSNFNRQFLAEMGCSPKAYRNKKAEM